MSPDINSKSRWKVDHLSSLINHSVNFVPFVFLTETWCKSYMTDAQLSIDNYAVHRADRKLRKKGGSIIYVHETFDVSSSLHFDNKFVEVVLLHIDDIRSTLVCVYRPPNCPLSKFKEATQFIDQNLMKSDDWTLYIAGDFNLPIINWTTLTLKTGYTTEEQESAILHMDMKSKTFTSQYVDVDTRKVPGESGNILDLFLTNDSELFQDISTEDTIMSDHKLVTIDLGYNLSNGQLSTSEHHIPEHSCNEDNSLSQFNFNNANFEEINEQLRNIDWDSLKESNSEEGFIDAFYSEIFTACKNNLPIKSTKRSNYTAPSNSVTKSTLTILRNLSRKRRKIKRRLEFLNIFQPTSPFIKVLKNKFKSVEVESKEAITKDKQAQERKAAETIKSNPQYFYSYAKRFSKRRSKIGPLKVKQGNSTTLLKDPKRMADALQEFFKSIFSDPDCINADDYNINSMHTFNNPSHPTLEWFNFTIKDIMKAISEIKSSSSSGEDGFSASFLKNCKESLSYPIYLIWKQSLDSGFIHKSFLSQMITPVHKKGSKSKPENYRPISLTSHITKIFERIVRDRLVHFLEQNNLLNSFQHGFRHGHSCLSELLVHFNDILTDLNQGNDVDVIYLDFAKAFDKVDHKVLLKKIQHLGISGKLYEWIKSFLSNRSQKVVVDGLHSFITLVISGVPQGTVLGPILFLIYLNDMCLSTKYGSTIRSFADDSRLFHSISTYQDALNLQYDLNNLIAWASENNMTLHQDKFEVLQYSSSLYHPKSLLEELPFNEYARYYTSSDECLLEATDQVKDLGIHMSSQLNFSSHINIIVDKACSKAAWALSIFQSRNKEIMMNLFKSIVQPLLEYCCPLWHPNNITDIQSSENVQRNFTSKISGLANLCYWDRLKQLNLMSLQR